MEENKKLTKTLFTILYSLYKISIHSQRELSELCGLSLGTVNKYLKLLRDKRFVDGYLVTELGQKALEKYKVDNAIIMAAGISPRFAPISYELPKGLLKVNGEILIERQIEQLREAGIKEIVVVVGYMKERLFYLEDKYNVKILVNNDYHKRNNHSTLYVAREYLGIHTYVRVITIFPQMCLNSMCINLIMLRPSLKELLGNIA